MARKILNKANKERLKFYFPTKISWNPFAYLDRKAKRIPKNILLAMFFLAVSLALLKVEDGRRQQRILGLQTKLQADQKSAFDWEQILLERPDYRDGWIQLAAIYNKLGDNIKAKAALSRAKALDPTNETILSLEKLLNN